MELSVKTIKRMILCLNEITDKEIKEYFDLFQNVNIEIPLQYISMLKLNMLIMRMYLLGLNINLIIKKNNLNHPLDFLKISYEECSDINLEYIINFYLFFIKYGKKKKTNNIFLNRIALDIMKICRTKYKDIIILKKIVNNYSLTESEIVRINYLNKIFGEERISYILTDEMYESIFHRKPNREEIYQDIDERTNDKYLPFEEYEYVFK